MKITDDVIRDLMAIYHAGEGSTDTRNLVEAYLAEHPDLAEEALRGENWSLPPVSHLVTPEEERVALRRTKKLLAWRSWVMGAAIFFTALPLSFGGGSRTGLRWLMWPEHAQTAALSLALGIVAWVVYGLLRRRLAPKGF